MSTLPAAPPIKYVLGYRSRTPTLTLNTITDPNPNPKNKEKQNDTGIKFNIELYVKINFIGHEWGYKRPIYGTGRETHMDIPVF